MVAQQTVHKQPPYLEVKEVAASAEEQDRALVVDGDHVLEELAEVLERRLADLARTKRAGDLEDALAAPQVGPVVGSVRERRLATQLVRIRVDVEQGADVDGAWGREFLKRAQE